YVAKRDGVPGMRKIRATMETQRERGLWDSNMMVLGPRLLSLMFFFPTISYILVGGMGASPEVPSFGEYPAWLRFYGFANASVWEEIIIRIFFIGIPLSYAYHVRSGGQRGVGRKIILRGLGKMTPLAFWLLLFSSFMFAMAHAFGGWDFYKVPPTFFTGLCLGYAFIMKGLPAAIVLHFALDFFTMPSFMVPALWPVVELAFIILVLAGAYNTIKYGVAIFSKKSMPGIKSASTRRL
ncbi:MAG: CPBP family intramembrane metalloprotease, partial [Candidatus Thermoplasmatota archaeon]|nr:CPBP family intramembrane metalloprotease [Candidatus Thermoplasmatota archaeon]